MSEPTQARIHLASVPKQYATPDPAIVSTIPMSWGDADYVGHADITLILAEIDPEYDYGWAMHADGRPIIDHVGNRLVLWGWVTLHGVTRRGVGTCGDKKQEPEKELIGDLLRNCAMRFGIATRLWSKAEQQSEDGDHRYAKPEQVPDLPPVPDDIRDRVNRVWLDRAKLSDEQKEAIKAMFAQAGVEPSKRDLGEHPEFLAELEATIDGWLAEVES